MTSTTSQRPSVGDPTADPAASASPPAWHPDPVGRFPLRYWDGTTWTARVVNAERQVGIDRGWSDALLARREQTAAAAAAASAAAVNPAAMASAPLAAGPPPTPTVTPAGPTRPSRSDRPVAWVKHAVTRAPHQITGWRVAAAGGVVIVLLGVVLMGSWASAARSYDAQEAWQHRADRWQVRAEDHADERDLAIARIGQTRAHNRDLNEEIADLEGQIEGLASDNAGLEDENQVLRDALASLGYQLVP